MLVSTRTYSCSWFPATQSPASCHLLLSLKAKFCWACEAWQACRSLSQALPVCLSSLMDPHVLSGIVLREAQDMLLELIFFHVLGLYHRLRLSAYGAKQLYQCVLIWYEPWSMPVCKYLVAMQPRMMQTSFNVNFNLPLYLLDWVISERPESDFTKVAAYTTSPHNLCKCLHSRSDYVWYLVKRWIHSYTRSS